MKKDDLMDWIGLVGLIGLLVCFWCTIAAAVYDNKLLAHAVRIGWMLSAGAAALSLADSVIVMIRTKKKLASPAAAVER